MRRIWFIGALALGLGLGLGGHLDFVGAQNQAEPKKLNPFTGNPAAIKEGRNIYFLYSCNGCHGGTGGGGMAGAPPLFDDEWNYGSDDKTLYMLMQGQIPNQLMPPIGAAMTDEEVWKALAWIRSIYKGDPNLVNW
jgi:mono/diheme cytochrome c family protein